MQISYEYKMQTVILRYTHKPAGPPWLLRDFKNYAEHRFGVDMLSAQ